MRVRWTSVMLQVSYKVYEPSQEVLWSSVRKETESSAQTVLVSGASYDFQGWEMASRFASKITHFFTTQTTCAAAALLFTRWNNWHATNSRMPLLNSIMFLLRAMLQLMYLLSSTTAHLQTSAEVLAVVFKMYNIHRTSFGSVQFSEGNILRTFLVRL